MPQTNVFRRTLTKDLQKQIEKTTSDYDHEKLQERLGKLSAGVAVIRVGTPSEAEMKNRKEALEDAISARKRPLPKGLSLAEASPF